MEQWKVGAEQSGMTLLAFVKGQLGPSFSSNRIKRTIDSGGCTLNGKCERFGSKLVGKGDVIGCDLPKISTPKDRSANVLYADDALVAYDKPSGLSSDSPSLLAVVHRSYPGSILLHRLDKETTGVLLFARNAQLAKRVEAMFKQRAVKKQYHALVDGSIRGEKGTIDNVLGKIFSYQGQSVWGEVAPGQGLPARTDWEVVERGTDATLLLCRPLTGRTHQIRVHLSGMGHPILGDSQYGKTFKCPFRPKRCLLHASELAFEHPVTGKEIKIRSPFPEDFKEAIASVMEGR